MSSAKAQVTKADTFDWTGRLPSGATLRVFGTDGAITVSRASGDQVVVHGQRRPSYGQYQHDGYRTEGPLAFERLQDGNNVTVCAYEADEGSCGADGVHEHSHHRRWDSSPSADFTIQVPAGIRITLGTGDGDVNVRGVGAEVSASTGDGDITVDETSGPVHASSGDGRVSISTTTGPVEVSTGDGAIEVHMASLSHPGDMHFSTGDGAVTIYLPASLSAELDVNTGDGHIESEFPLEVQGRLNAPHIHAAIGGGGPTRLSISTGDGDVRIRRAAGSP
jgi:hypothetical protein